MKYLSYLSFVMVALICSGGTGLCQSSQCVIMEKHDNMALVSCGGGATQNINLGGKADIYKVGDAVSVPNSQKGTDQKSTGRNRESTERRGGGR